MESVQARSANRGHLHVNRVPGCSGGRLAMLPETRELLQSFYAPLNEMLAAQLGDQFRW